jgi:dipeptidyl aminopeptidase/acylaminoacyl peptidase
MMKRALLIAACLPLAFQSTAQERMTPELLWELGRVSGQTLSPDGKTVIYGVTKYDVAANKGNMNLFAVPVKGGEPMQLTSMEGSEYDAQFTPDGTKIGFMHGGQLWEMNPDGTDAKQVTNVEGGFSSFKYAPAGDRIAIIKTVKLKDVSGADRYEDLPQSEALIYDDLMYRHWDSWNTGEFQHVFVGTYSNGEVSNLEDIMKDEPYDCPQKPFGGSEDMAWHPSGTALVYAAKKKEGVEYATSTNTDLYLYNVGSKTTKNITTGMVGYDMHPTWSPDGTYLAWNSMKRDGYESDKNDIILWEFNGSEKTNLTKDWDETVSSFAFNAKGDGIYFQAAVNATYQLFELSLEGGEPRQITKGDHNIGGILGETKKELIAGKMDMNHASELFAFSKKKGESRVITHENDAIYANLKLSPIQKRWIKTTDGKDMLTWVILPPDFDSTRTYPALLYCQGGPQSAVSQFYSFRWNFQLMAANDYIIIAPNRRGLPSFGTEWNEAISQDWGGQPMKDYLAAFDAVAKEPYVDENNAGAVGASYGGYSVYMLAGIHENRFKSFVSHCGLFNLESWYGSTEELFFANFDIGGPYWESPAPESYAKFSPHRYAQNWNTPILVIHGGNDFRVPDTQGMEAYQVARLKGLKSRFLYFPNEGHWVLKPQNGLVWHREYFKWLDETLKN